MVSSKEFREKKSSDQLLVNKGSHFKDWLWSPIVFASINNPMIINQDRGAFGVQRQLGDIHQGGSVACPRPQHHIGGRGPQQAQG